MNQNSIPDLKYFLIPGRPKVGSPAMEIHNIAFEFWRNFWTDVFKKNGVADHPSADDFLRQDLISVILHENKVVSLHLYSFFDLALKATNEHSYFKDSYTEKAMQGMSTQGARHVMSMEYFSVAPEWQKKSIGLSIALTMLSLGIRIFTRSQADMLLGVSRVDVGVAKLSYEIGGLPLDQGLILHGTPCDIVGCPRGLERFPRGEAENRLGETLWNQRLELAQAPNEHAFPLKKVA